MAISNASIISTAIRPESHIFPGLAGHRWRRGRTCGQSWLHGLSDLHGGSPLVKGMISLFQSDVHKICWFGRSFIKMFPQDLLVCQASPSFFSQHTQGSTRTRESLRNAAVYHGVKVNEFQAPGKSWSRDFEVIWHRFFFSPYICRIRFLLGIYVYMDVYGGFLK